MKTIRQLIESEDDEAPKSFDAMMKGIKHQSELNDFRNDMMNSIKKRVIKSEEQTSTFNAQGWYKHPIGTRFVSSKGNIVTINGYGHMEQYRTNPKTGERKKNRLFPLPHLTPKSLQDSDNTPSYYVHIKHPNGEESQTRANVWHFGEPWEKDKTFIRLHDPDAHQD